MCLGLQVLEKRLPQSRQWTRTWGDEDELSFACVRQILDTEQISKYSPEGHRAQDSDQGPLSST